MERIETLEELKNAIAEGGKINPRTGCVMETCHTCRDKSYGAVIQMARLRGFAQKCPECGKRLPPID